MGEGLLGSRLQPIRLPHGRCPASSTRGPRAKVRAGLRLTHGSEAEAGYRITPYSLVAVSPLY